MNIYKYDICQLSNYTDYMFENWNYAKEHGFDLFDYKKVYSGEEEARDERDLLDYLFEKFNINHPEDFRGHSVSVSDLILIYNENIASVYYCDSFGWKRIGTIIL